MSACARLLLVAVLAGEWWCAESEVVSVGVGGGGGGGGPRFAARQRTAVAVAAGQPAALACTVLHLHDKTVSWVRSRDLQIVCHAGASFTADARVACEASREARGVPAPAEVHALRVARARLSDSGLYECQVNTEPKMSLLFNLTVVDEPVPVVVVEPEQEEVAGALGAAATLACAARYRPAPRRLPAPALRVAWARAATAAPVSVRSARGGVSLEAEVSEGGARVVSRLTLTALRPDDAGLYTCSAGNVSATVALRVLDYEHDDVLEPSQLEAMQRDEAHTHARARAAPRCSRSHAPLVLFVPLAYTISTLLRTFAIIRT